MDGPKKSVGRTKPRARPSAPRGRSDRLRATTSVMLPAACWHPHHLPNDPRRPAGGHREAQQNMHLSPPQARQLSDGPSRARPSVTDGPSAAAEATNFAPPTCCRTPQPPAPPAERFAATRGRTARGVITKLPPQPTPSSRQKSCPRQRPQRSQTRQPQTKAHHAIKGPSPPN